MLGRILQTDLSVPYRLRGYLYFTRTEEGKQYPVQCRKREAENAPEELLIDLNALAAGHSFLSLGAFAVSDDNSLLAYSLDTTGFRQYALHVKDLRTDETLAIRIERVTSAAWAADNRTIFYTVEDETTKRSYRLYRHTLGAGGPDVLLYEEHDERFRIDIERTRSGTFLLLTVASHTASEVRFLPATQPNANFRLIAPREDNHEYYADHHPGTPSDTSGGMFYIRTNSGGRTFRLVTVQVDDPHPEFFTGHLRFQYESFITPRSVFDYDLRSGEQILRKQQPVLGGYDPSQYASERLFAHAPDGTNILLSVVYHRDTPRDGSAPLLLYGYGSYGISVPVNFSSNRLSLLDRGMIYAIAHVRGGGELGKPWHDA